MSEYKERTIEIDGYKFVKDTKTGYYLCSTIRERLHRYVWKKHYGEIPSGCDIHHIDFNKDNNDISNLALMTEEAHHKLHGDLLTPAQREARRKNMDEAARPAACIWHKSEEGRAWHKNQYEQMKDKLQARVEETCDNCGKKYMGTISGSRFCSNACKSAWRRKMKLDDRIYTCCICGQYATKNRFKLKDKDHITCGNACTYELKRRKSLDPTLKDTAKSKEIEFPCA